MGFTSSVPTPCCWGSRSLTGSDKIPLLFLASGPIVHFSRGEAPRGGVGSFAVRLAGAGLGIMIGLSTEECRGDNAEFLCDNFGRGLIAGLVAEIAFDSWVLARRTVKRDAPRIVPTASVTRGGGMQVGLGGQF